MRKLLSKVLAITVLFAAAVGNVSANPRNTFKFEAPVHQASAQYASKVAIDGDFALISTPGGVASDAGPSANNEGVRVYRKDIFDRWNLELTLLPAGSDDEDFGVDSIALDGQTAVISATGSDGSGVVWVFNYDEIGGWNEGVRVQSPQPISADGYGNQIAIDSNVLVIASVNPRRLHVLERQEGSIDWVEQSQLTSNSLLNDDFFGNAIAVSGNTIAAGSGSVHLYERDENIGEWAFVQTLESNSSPSFGSFLDIDGDRLVVGSEFVENNTNSVIPADAYNLFARDSNSQWNLASTLALADPQNSDMTLTLSPNEQLEGGPVQFTDGFIVALVTPPDSTGLPRLFYRFDETDGTWSLGQGHDLPRANPQQQSGLLREPLSLSVDSINALVGVPNNDLSDGSFFIDAGAAYLFNIAPVSGDLEAFVDPTMVTVEQDGSAEFKITAVNPGNIAYNDSVSFDSPFCVNTSFGGPFGAGQTWEVSCEVEDIENTFSFTGNVSAVGAENNSQLITLRMYVLVPTGTFLVDSTVSPSPAIAGEPLTITTVIENTGETALFDLTAAYSIDGSDELTALFSECNEDAIALTDDASTLESGASVTITCTLDSAPDLEGELLIDVQSSEQAVFDNLFGQEDPELTIESVEQATIELATDQYAIDFTSPAEGSTLLSGENTFEWEAIGNIEVVQWWLYLGADQGRLDYFNSSVGLQTSQSVATLPTDGTEVWARLWYRIEGSGANEWEFIDRSFIASGEAPIITSPVPVDDMSLLGASAAFEWDPRSSQAQEYWLFAGSSIGGQEYFNSRALGNATTTVVGNLPADGQSTVYVRLWYRAAIGPWKYVDTVYTASDIGGRPLTTLPEEESFIDTLLPTTYAWNANGSGATQWWVNVGAAQGQTEYFSSGLLDGAQSSIELTGLPANGSEVWVRLWYRIGTEAWRFIDTLYMAIDAEPQLAFDVENPAGDVLGIEWEDVTEGEAGIDAWWLYVGSADDETLYLNSGELLLETTQMSVSGLVRDSRQNVVRLWYRISGDWRSVVKKVELDP